jgi:hypothetical protein
MVRSIVPVPVVFSNKLQIGKVASNSSHDYLAMTPWWAKVKVKRVVFDVRAASICLVKEKKILKLKHRKWPGKSFHILSERYHRRDDLLQPLK